MNYEYTPKHKKTCEILLSMFAFLTGLVIYYIPIVWKLPYPLPFQLAMVVAFIAAVLILNRYVLRSFTYRVETDPRDPNASDFVICEHYGRRHTIVCRVGVARIRSVTRIDKNARAELAERMKGHRTYLYIAEISAPDACVVEACADDDPEGESIFIKICADDTLFSCLSVPKSNICLSNNEN